MARNIALHVLRGTKANMPLLNDGEIYLCTDTKELFVGAGGNSPVGVPIFNAAGLRKASPHLVVDKVTIPGSGSITITLTGPSAFTTATSYVCIASDITMKNRAPAVLQVSGSQITFTANAGDVVQYICVGN